MNARGSMLIEVLVGAAIVAIAGAGIALMFGAGGAWIDAAGDNRGALTLAQQQLERYRARGYYGFAPGGPFVEPSVADHPLYRRVTLVRCVDPDDYTRIFEDCLPTTVEFWLIPAKEILVTVSVPSNPKARTVALSTVMAAR